MTRTEVIAYLRWLADQPDGLAHRHALFRAAHIIANDRATFAAKESA